MYRLKRRVPLDYSKCGQTVTVYHLDAAGAVHRSVITGAYLEQKRTHAMAKTGGSEESGFLLVVPQSSCAFVPPAQYTGAPRTYTMASLDKVLPGEGPPLTTEEWPGFIPAKIPGLVVVASLAVKYWQGAVCHVEAS